MVYITWVYKNPNFKQRLTNWETLKRLGRGRNTSWFCVGDFNDINSHHEKVGSRQKTQSYIDEFNSVIHNLRLGYLGYKGQPFTWSNNRREWERVRDRLDCALTNATWMTEYPNTLVFHEATIGSDHSPLSIKTSDCDGISTKRLNFEEM